MKAASVLLIVAVVVKPWCLRPSTLLPSS